MDSFLEVLSIWCIRGEYDKAEQTVTLARIFRKHDAQCP